LIIRAFRVIDATTKLRAMIAGLKTRLPATTAPANPLPSSSSKQQAGSSNAAEEAARIGAAVTGTTSAPESSTVPVTGEPQQAPGAENNEAESEVTFSVEREPSADNVQETAAGEGNGADDAAAMDTTEQHPSQEQEGDDSDAESMMSEEEARLWRRRFVSAARYVCY
jgi:hypothetical protein